MMSVFSCIARAMLQHGDWGIALSVQAHFDESGTSSNSDEVTMAGYIFEESKIVEFSEKWQDRLAQSGLDYFHMVECAHGNNAFKGMKRRDRIRILMDLMRLIKDHAVNGIVCNIRNNKDNAGVSYRELVESAFRETSRWADTTAYEGKIAFFFEAGASGFGLAEAFFNEVKGNPANPLYSRYSGHSYIEKLNNPGIQAADLLAWQYHNVTKKRKASHKIRLDAQALLRFPHAIYDDCGDLPCKSQYQTIEESRLYKEIVYYLPLMSKEPLGSVIVLGEDFKIKSKGMAKTVMACSNCFRSLTEGIAIDQISKCYIKCSCGKYSYASGKWDLRLLERPAIKA